MAAFRLFLSRFVLDDVPVLGENTFFEPNNINHDPIRHAGAEPGESLMKHHEISVGNSQLVFVAHGARRLFDELEETFSSRRDMRAMLNVMGGPEFSRRRVIALIEQGIKGGENDGLVSFGGRFVHDCGCKSESLNCVTRAPSFGPGLLRNAFARCTRTSWASVPRTPIVSSMKSARGMARGSLF